MRPIESVLLKAIGKPVRRKEDERLVTGRGRFTDDFVAPGQAYAAMVRSPYPHARIRGVVQGKPPGQGVRCRRGAGFRGIRVDTGLGRRWRVVAGYRRFEARAA